MAITYTKAACHCKLNTFAVGFASSSMPLAVDMCHCNTCRHSTGQMSVHCRRIEGEPLSWDGEQATSSEKKHAIATLDYLKKYKISETLTRYFCSRCSAYIFDRTDLKDGPRWDVSTGVLERDIGQFVTVDHHAYVEDTLDGGLSDHYLARDGVEQVRYKSDLGNGEIVPPNWKSEKVLAIQRQPLKEDDTLSAYCHCRTIDLFITRAPTEIANPANKWWLVPPHTQHPNATTRYLAVYCLCNSCRLCSGSVIQSWLYAPPASIIDKRTSSPVVIVATKDTPRTKGLKSYESSPGVYRESCETCGALIFFWRTSREPRILDISAGLIDQEQEGARAERWFAWGRDIENPEDAVDKAGLAAMENGLRNKKDLYDM